MVDDYYNSNNFDNQEKKIIFKNYYLIYKNLISNTSNDNLRQMKRIVYNLLLNSNLNNSEKEFLIRYLFNEDQEFMCTSSSSSGPSSNKRRAVVDDDFRFRNKYVKTRHDTTKGNEEEDDDCDY